MNTCQACGAAIPRTMKVCEECKDGAFPDLEQEEDLEQRGGQEEGEDL